ncbi:MAG: hypothetical protein SCH98_14215, partial [Deferrisomatales bacterium]|nr:hypothetical protein [Deferrisomatales bacterium]
MTRRVVLLPLLAVVLLSGCAGVVVDRRGWATAEPVAAPPSAAPRADAPGAEPGPTAAPPG